MPHVLKGVARNTASCACEHRVAIDTKARKTRCIFAAYRGRFKTEGRR